MTAGVLLDRCAGLPFGFSLAGTLAALTAWITFLRGPSAGLRLVFLAATAALLGAAYHHYRRNLFPASDIGNYASAEPAPARVRGQLVEEPTIVVRLRGDPLVSIPRPDMTVAVLEATALRRRDDWLPVSGRLRLVLSNPLAGPHLGDRVEVVGRISTPPGPANPGEADQAALLQDEGIRAQLMVQRTNEALVIQQEGWQRTVRGSLAVLRGWGQRALERYVGPEESGVAAALLLGEGSTMSSADWEKYIRTGVIHVLAISGQHLVVLAAFLWIWLRLLGIRRRWGAVSVTAFLLFYALLTGARPPVVRAAATATVGCGAILLGRPVLAANTLAAAWLAVLCLNPTDVGNAGCQLSFLAVAMLYWGVPGWSRQSRDPLARLVEQSQPAWQRPVREGIRWALAAYAINGLVWLTAAPLVAGRYHLVSPVALLVGPPVVLITSAALVSGFVLLLAAPLCPPLAIFLGWVTRWLLAACESVVRTADALPGGHCYVPDVASWWLWGFYAGLATWLIVPSLRPRWRWALLAGLVWIGVGMGTGWKRAVPRELRCTFLAVGHGGCTVLETDGRVLLYDAGAIGGPDVTRRQIAPYLWNRGIRRIDEVFLSHADLDHFNGLPALLERFAIGQVTCTPTFADKAEPGVPVTLDALQSHRVPMLIVRAGDRLSVGALTLDVLHPPGQGPPGKENARSMVLLVRHEGHTILLTGDLEGAGLERVLGLSLGTVDVLMAPHHGSRSGAKGERVRRAELVQQTRPAVVVACEGMPRWPPRGSDPYRASGAAYLGTWPEGAVTIVSRPGRLTVETFLTGQRFDIPTRQGRASHDTEGQARTITSEGADPPEDRAADEAPPY